MLEKIIDDLRSEILVKESNEKKIYETINSYSLKYEEISNNYQVLLKTQELLNKASSLAREKAKGHLESIVTMALNQVYGNDSKFVIELDNQRGVPSAEFYVVTTVDGIESKQIPQEDCGGGYINVISTALRFAYLKAFNHPRINNAILLDEPGSMISEYASVKYAEFIQKLCELFNKQTILITHSESLKAVADNSIIVEKGEIDGESKIRYE